MPFYLGPSHLIAINTARGCPYRCTFCYNTALYKGFNRYRVKGLDAVDEEVAARAALRPRALIVMDDDFLANRRRGMEMLDRLNRSFPKLRYRIDARADEESGSRRRRARCRGRGWRVSSSVSRGSPGSSSNGSARGTRPRTQPRRRRSARQTGIPGNLFLHLRLPRRDTARPLSNRVEMARLLGELNPAGRSQIEIISPVMGTPLYDEMQQRPGARGGHGLWCRFSDWKSAEAKGWIADAHFYESFQLAFYLAFSSRHSNGGMRLATRILSRWSRYRLCGKRPARLPVPRREPGPQDNDLAAAPGLRRSAGLLRTPRRRPDSRGGPLPPPSMRICYVSHSSSHFTRPYLAHFARQGHDVHISISLLGPALPGFEVHHPLGVDPGLTGRKFGYLFALGEVARILARLQPSLVHAHYVISNGLVAAWSGRRPLVVSAHGIGSAAIVEAGAARRPALRSAECE